MNGGIVVLAVTTRVYISYPFSVDHIESKTTYNYINPKYKMCPDHIAVTVVTRTHFDGNIIIIFIYFLTSPYDTAR